MVKVATTKILSDQFQARGDSLEQFVKDFTAWKCAGSKGEDDYYPFGKDSAYVVPHVNGNKNVLRHVHLAPIADTNALELWQKNWERYARRTSDRVLVYVADGANLLLIAILEEPCAHAIAQMRTQEDKELMEQFAQIADAFIFQGSIIS